MLGRFLEWSVHAPDIGLHARDAFTPALTFVKPGLLRLVDDLERLGVELELRRLGDHEFNEVGWFGPSACRRPSSPPAPWA